MQKKFQIFVSSTFTDLKDERRAVIEAILDLGHIPIGMEAFQAGNEEQWGYIKKRIDESDYYVVLVAERYGSEKDGVSYTEMEYDYAREKGVPAAAFLLLEDARKDWRASKAEFIDNSAKVNAFRKKCEGLMVRYWRDKGELEASCVKSLVQMFGNFPRDGWIPAKDAMAPDVAQELARLSRENEELRDIVEKFRVNSEEDNIIMEMDGMLVRKLEYVENYSMCLIKLLSFILDDAVIEGDDIKGVFLYRVKGGYKLDRYINPAHGVECDEFIVDLLLMDIIEKQSCMRKGYMGFNAPHILFKLTDFGKRVVRRLKQREKQQPEIQAALG